MFYFKILLFLFLIFNFFVFSQNNQYNQSGSTYVFLPYQKLNTFSKQSLNFPLNREMAVFEIQEHVDKLIKKGSFSKGFQTQSISLGQSYKLRFKSYKYDDDLKESRYFFETTLHDYPIFNNKMNAISTQKGLKLMGYIPNYLPEDPDLKSNYLHFDDASIKSAFLDFLQVQHDYRNINSNDIEIMDYQLGYILYKDYLRFVWQVRVKFLNSGMINTYFFDAESFDYFYHVPQEKDVYIITGFDVNDRYYDLYKTSGDYQFIEFENTISESRKELAKNVHDNCVHSQRYFHDKFSLTTLGRENNPNLVLYADLNSNLSRNAFYNSDYGPNDQIVFSHQFAPSLMIMAHEYAHGITYYRSNLAYSSQSGALNEAFSDIFSYFVAAHYGQASYQLDESIGYYLRNLKQPSLLSIDAGYENLKYPDTLNEYYHFRNLYDNQGVHINSGIVNRAFVLMLESLNEVSATERNLADLEKIFFRVNDVELVSFSDFYDLEFAVLRACEDLFFNIEGVDNQRYYQLREVIERSFDTVEIHHEDADLYYFSTHFVSSNMYQDLTFNYDNLSSASSNGSSLRSQSFPLNQERAIMYQGFFTSLGASNFSTSEKGDNYITFLGETDKNLSTIFPFFFSSSFSTFWIRENSLDLFFNIRQRNNLYAPNGVNFLATREFSYAYHSQESLNYLFSDHMEIVSTNLNNFVSNIKNRDGDIFSFEVQAPENSDVLALFFNLTMSKFENKVASIFSVKVFNHEGRLLHTFESGRGLVAAVCEVEESLDSHNPFFLVELECNFEEEVNSFFENEFLYEFFTKMGVLETKPETVLAEEYRDEIERTYVPLSSFNLLNASFNYGPSDRFQEIYIHELEEAYAHKFVYTSMNFQLETTLTVKNPSSDILIEEQFGKFDWYESPWFIDFSHNKIFQEINTAFPPPFEPYLSNNKGNLLGIASLSRDDYDFLQTSALLSLDDIDDLVIDHIVQENDALHFRVNFGSINGKLSFVIQSQEMLSEMTQFSFKTKSELEENTYVLPYTFEPCLSPIMELQEQGSFIDISITNMKENTSRNPFDYLPKLFLLNESTEEVLPFEIRDFLVGPNPLRTNQDLVFQFSANRSFMLEADLISLSGRHVATFRHSVEAASQMFTSYQLKWPNHALMSKLIPNGAYYLMLRFEPSDGTKAVIKKAKVGLFL